MQKQEEKKDEKLDYDIINDHEARAGGYMNSGREFADTKKIDASCLNYKKVEVRVHEGLVKEGGIFSSNYVTYRITTAPLNFDVRRKDADFYFLKKILNRQFPHIIVPPLPQKSNK